MYRSAPRLIFRLPTPLIRNTRPQRYFSNTQRSQRSRSWKNSAIRWGLAIGGIYYYNTSNVFAEEPAFIVTPISPTDEAPIPTLESLAPSRQPKPSASLPPTSTTPSSQEVLPNPAVEDSTPLSEAEDEDSPAEGAFNEETGEINWDCPCLGGMAHGPCGEQFRTAFSCFVFSKEEPKGMECIDNFKDMQDCFRQHPEIYEEGQPPETFDTEVDQPSTFDPPPARPSNPQVDEPSVYQPPSPPSSSPIYPQVDEPLRTPTEPVQTPSPNLEAASQRAEPAAPFTSPEEKKPAAVSR